MLERYGHGGDWMTATNLYGVPVEQMIDFSANINPLGPPEGLRNLLFREWNGLTRYPDPDSRDLRAAIAARYEIDPASILIGNGAAELIDLIARTITPRTAAVVDPTFSEYADALHKVGAKIVSVPATAENDFAIPLEKLLEFTSTVDLITLGQPNNPTGKWLDVDSLSRLINQAEKSGTVIVLDEAFLDFFEEERAITQICRAEQHRRLIVIRSMTKFYAIPGLRLGYTVAHPETIKRLKQLQVPWSVNHLAQKAGLAVLNDQPYERLTRQLIREERTWLVERLGRWGLRTFEGSANFILIKLPEAGDDEKGTGQLTATMLQKRLGETGILIRRCANFIGLDDQYFRIAVRTRAENERLIDSLARAMAYPLGAERYGE